MLSRDLDKDFEQILNDLNFSQQVRPSDPEEATALLKSLTFEEVKVPSCHKEDGPDPKDE